MINNAASLTDITIPNGQTTSRIVVGPNEYNDAEMVLLYAPAVLAEAVTIQVNRNPDGSGVWDTLQIGGVDAAAPVATKAKPFGKELCGSLAFRLVAGVAVAADRIFQCTKQWST